MDYTPSPAPSEAPAASRQLLHTALFATAMLLIPLLIGLLFVMMLHKLKPVATLPPPGAGDISNRLDEVSATNLARLIELRRDLRNEGQSIDEVNLMIWAAHAQQPTVLFQIEPPESGKRWNWYLSQDGLFAIAVSIQTDAFERRTVGLFDLADDEWLWKNNLPWPDSHEAPYVFNRHLVLRYSKNAARFAMEINAQGTIIGIDKLGTSAFTENTPLYPIPGFPGDPVAIRNNVLFATNRNTPDLVGYALERIPGLYPAGKGNDNTVFSGNGRLKFSVGEGRVTVSDSLTQTVLQRIDAWPHTTNTTVSGVLVTHDGAQLSVFLKTVFAGPPEVTREWSVSIATYTGTLLSTFNADALLAKPKRVQQRQTCSSDNRWQVSVRATNILCIVDQPQKREVAHIDLGSLLNVAEPIDHIAFLDEERHLMLRQGDTFWLLDFATACGYADLLARMSDSAVAAAALARAEAEQPAPAAAPVVPEEDLFFAEALQPEYPSPAPLALRAEWYASHQAWPYAAALLETCVAHSAMDGRAPRVNPLLLARAHLLSGQRQQARLVCREALMRLMSDPSDYNRMIRYQLQGLLFSQP